MRKIVMFNLVSVDGFFAGPDGNIDWHVVDEEFNQAAVAMIERFDTMLFGRTTYQLFESYWPNAAKDPATSKEDRIIADKINEMTKIVFSKTLDKVTWAHAQLVHALVPQAIENMKHQPGRDIVIYGSGTIVQQLTTLGLLDEYQLLVNPVILGTGKPLFKDVQGTLKLQLLSTKQFRSGNVLLTYQRG
jgi:dihydrofolate reductase